MANPSPTGPYTVDVVNTGCPHCGRGSTWTVRGPVLPDWERDNVHLTERDALGAAEEYNVIWAAAVASVSTSSTEPTT